jgi:RimJ/RimL family protein N-acetyltransferase
MIQLESDIEIMKFTPFRVPQSKDKTEQRLRSQIEKQVTYAPLGIWAAEWKESKEFIGWFMLIKTTLDFPELGFMIVRKYWGQGLAPEIAGSLIEYAKMLGVPCINAVTDPTNTASMRVLQRLGFRFLKTASKFDKVLAKEIESSIFELRL